MKEVLPRLWLCLKKCTQIKSRKSSSQRRPENESLLNTGDVVSPYKPHIQPQGASRVEASLIVDDYVVVQSPLPANTFRTTLPENNQLLEDVLSLSGQIYELTTALITSHRQEKSAET